MQKSLNDMFIEKSLKIHNNRYDYSKSNYIDSSTKIEIICKIHGSFWQSPNNHLSKKQGCPNCKKIKLSELFSKNAEVFIKESNLVHNNFYDYTKTNYKQAHKKVEIICKLHGSFWQEPVSHLKGRGCPKCKTSKGEKIIEQFLKQQQIKYENQKRFIECKNKRSLPFDFYLSEYNTCIEYDGEQHFKPFRFKNQEKAINKFKQTQLHDKIKKEFCMDKHIKLIRISYLDFKNINSILSTLLK